MSDQNAVELIFRADRKFGSRTQLDQFRDEIAHHFAPWDASWQQDLVLGEDFAAHLIDGTPLLLARDYINQIGSILRPAGKQWFWRRTGDEKLNEDAANRAYLDWRSKQTMRAIFERETGAVSALKHSDRFYGLYGDAVLSVDVSDRLDGLRIKSYHSKDCVWSIGPSNKADVFTRREKMTVRNMAWKFGEEKLHPKTREKLAKTPDMELVVQHDVMPAEDYDRIKNAAAFARKPGEFVSIWTDVEQKHVMRQATQPTMRYVVPRSVTLPNNPYGISMATIIALPDARLIQQQALAILEAAERQVDPPIVAMDGDAIRGDIDLSRGKITWVDRAYDDRTGAPLVPLELAKNFQLGVESLMRTEAQITRAFHLDQLRMPDTGRTKAVEEVQFLIDEYIRSALPLFAPMQVEYNAEFLYEVDNVLTSMGTWENDEIPQDLMQDESGIEFAWDNPLTDMIERQKATVVAEVGQLAQVIAALEAGAAQAKSLARLDYGEMFEDAVVGLQGSKYILEDEQKEEAQQGVEQQQQVDALMANAPNIAPATRKE
jgi:hypothetical protein